MRMLISLSQPELVITEYTGTKGCYSASVPDASGVKMLKGICDRLGLDTDTSKLHCTMMYSAKKAPAPDKVVAVTKEFPVCVTHVDHWIGHDGKGYLTAQLSSVSLHKEHARLLTVGCQDDYVPYKPHLTLYSEIDMDGDLREMMDVVNKELSRKPLFFSLVDQKISDMKD
jgi:hypothetical protein